MKNPDSESVSGGSNGTRLDSYNKTLKALLSYYLNPRMVKLLCYQGPCGLGPD
jgi:hypothetical protein